MLFKIGHSDHGLTTSQWEYVKAQLELLQPRGFFRMQLGEDEQLGTGLSALYGPAAGDAPVEEAEVRYEARNGRPVKSRLVRKPLRPCSTLVVIGAVVDNTCVIYTAYFGPARSPLEVGDHCLLTEAELEESRAFWAVHALADETSPS